MTATSFKRKLTAILSADVVGYSRLMGEDEAGTLKTLEIYKEVISDLIRQHRGRVVDSPGDNVLAEFASVVDAVQCAVAVQKELQARNSELLENRRMQFRIGINLGDVIEEGERIYGDGVNIAARLETLADPGGICVSKAAFDHIESKLPLGYEYLGEQTVKNIAKPVGAYRVMMEPRVTMKAEAKEGERAKAQGVRRNPIVLGALGAIVVLVIAAGVWQFALRPSPSRIEVASKEKMAFPLPDKPSIAVLPFVNMSDDPKQEYLADGFAEEIINGLSKCPHIVVIARNSSFTYKGKPVKVQQVAEELGVRYVLEGSLRKTSDKMRISAQLIDALTGQHVFSERYDRPLKDILAMQDEITMKILDAVQVKLTAGEDARLRAKGTTNLEAYLKVVQARQYMQTYNKGNYAVARELTEQALALDPHYAVAYTTLCRIQLMETVVGVYKNPREALEQALKLGEKAITLDDSNAVAHAALSGIYVWLREYDKAIAEAEKAVSLDPNSAYAYYALGSGLDYAGRYQEAIPFFQKSLRLSPIPVETTPFVRLAGVYRTLGQYEEAEAIYKKALQLYGADDLLVHVALAGTYAMMGREKEAQAEAAEVLRIDPTFSAVSLARRNPWKDQKVNDDYVSALRKAGLK
jgi:adenylate cyclase